MNSNPTQSQVILSVLRASAGFWVPMPILAAKSGAYAVHSRVSELRRKGHRIQNRVERHKDGTRVSAYRMEVAR